MYIREYGDSGKMYHLLNMLNNTPLEAWWNHRKNACLPEILDLDLEVLTEDILNVCFLQSSYMHFCCHCSMRAT